MKCEECDQEMLEADSCIYTYIKNGNKVYQRSRKHFEEPSGRCEDCGIKHGGVHHYGCDEETCPICGEQLISCDCFEGHIELLAEIRQVEPIH